MVTLSLGVVFGSEPIRQELRETGIRMAVHNESHGKLANRMEKVVLVALPWERLRAKQSISFLLFVDFYVVSPPRPQKRTRWMSQIWYGGKHSCDCIISHDCGPLCRPVPCPPPSGKPTGCLGQPGGCLPLEASHPFWRTLRLSVLLFHLAFCRVWISQRNKSAGSYF